MYIASFHIDGFGIFHNVDVRDLSGGLVVFLGKNEAGKSTCLEFLRLMLTGSPDPAEWRRHVPISGGSPSGSLILQCQGANGAEDEIRLARNAEVANLTLETPDGDPLPPQILSMLLGGVNAEIYRNVFGFGLNELEKFESLSEDAVQNALFGASFGPGLASPVEVLNILEQRKNKIFQPGDNSSILGEDMAALGNLRSKIEELENSGAACEALSLELNSGKAARESLRTEKNGLEEERRQLERRLASWRQWLQYSALQKKIGELAGAGGNFPADAEARMARMQEARDACERQLAKINARMEALREQKNGLSSDADLLEMLPGLRLLAERKSGYRQAASAISGQVEICALASRELEEGLSRLGPGWDCARIRATDRSLSASDAMERKAREMNEAITARKGSLIYLDNSNRDVELCEAEVEKTASMLENLPEVSAIMDDGEREALKRTMASLEESRKLVAGRERAVETARHAFSRAMQKMNPGAEDSGDGGKKILDDLLARQEDALALAGKMAASLEEASDAARILAQAAANEEAIRRRIEEHVNAQRKKESPLRENLEARTTALRSLRSTAASITAEKERLADIESRISGEKPIARIKSWTLMVFGIICLLLAATVFAAHWGLHLTAINLAENIIIPVNLWAGYAALACGVALLAGALSGNGPERRRRRQEMLQLVSRREATAKNLADLEARATRLCGIAGVDSMDDITLEATEVRLEHEKAQCFHDERSLEALNAEYANARNEAQAASQAVAEKEKSVRRCRGLWHGLMQGLKLKEVPIPEDASTFFARAEAARLAWDNVAAARNELESLRNDIGALEKQIADIPVIAARLGGNNPDLESAVRLTLESCREADQIQEKRVNLRNTLQNLEKELERARARQEEAARQLERAAANEEEARQKWTGTLASFGLSEDLNPETAREAFKCMESSLAAEDRLTRARREVERGREELAALEKPLGEMLEKHAMKPVLNSDNKPDWLITLDELLKNAEENLQNQKEKERITGELAAAQVEKGSEEAALANEEAKIHSLLKQAGTETEDDFPRLAKQHNEFRLLESRIRNLELELKSDAGEMSLERFLESFKLGSQEADEARLGEINSRLAAIEDEEGELNSGMAALSSRIKIISSTEDLSWLRQDEAMLRESARREAGNWSVYALAGAILEKAKAAFEEKRQPEIVRAASRIFSDITDGRWKGLSVSLDEKKLLVLPREGAAVGPEKLSRGAQEQIYLALRLAYIRSHSMHSGPLPVMMDEILVNFDPDRAKRTCAALADLARNKNGKAQQVFYFTCQPNMADMLREAAPDAQLYSVEGGEIAKG